MGIDADAPISPTQINAVRRCEAYYHFKYVLGLPDPAGPAAQRGKDIHAEVEAHYTQRKPLRDLSPHAQLLVKAVPVVPDAVELAFTLNYGDINYRGIIDVIANTDACAIVIDHKTSSNPREWGLSEDELLSDPQAIIYARAALERYNASEVLCRWQYVSTRGKPYILPVQALMSAPWVDERLERLTAIEAHTIVQLRTGKEPVKAYRADPMTNACSAYGGCPYYETCHSAPLIKPAIEAAPMALQSPKSSQIAPVTVDKPVGTLYIDCMPINGTYPLDAFAYLADVRGTFPGSDHRLVEYGKGKGELFGKAARYLTANPVEALYVSARTAWGADILETLQSLAARTIRGLL